MNKISVGNKLKNMFSNLIEKSYKIVLRSPNNNKPIVEKEELNKNVLKRLLGRNYGKVCIYDEEGKELLTKKYHGKNVHWDNDDTDNAEYAKKYFDANMRDAKIALTISMQVEEKDWPGFAKWTLNGKILTSTDHGIYTICNYVILNEKTGLYELLAPDSWMGVWDNGFSDTAASYSAHDVAYYGANYSFFRTAVIQKYNELRRTKDTKTNSTVTKKSKGLAGVHVTATAVTPEEMNTAVMKRLLGPYYDHVVIYDNETLELLREKHYEQKVFWDSDCICNAITAKRYLNSGIPNVKFARTVCMQVEKKDWPGFAKWTLNGQITTPTSDGLYTVCNYVILNEKTGLYELLAPEAWLGSGPDDRFPAGFVTRCMAYDATNCSANYSSFQTAIIQKYHELRRRKDDQTPDIMHTTPEIMNTAVMKRLLGKLGQDRYYSNIVIYDNEKQELDNYKDTLYFNSQAKLDALIATERFNAAFDGITLAKTLSMQVYENLDFPGEMKWRPSERIVMTSRDATCILCNYVIRNKKTGLYELLAPDAWVGVYNLIDSYNAFRNGAPYVAKKLAHDPLFLETIVQKYYECRRGK